MGRGHTRLMRDIETDMELWGRGVKLGLIENPGNGLNLNLSRVMKHVSTVHKWSEEFLLSDV